MSAARVNRRGRDVRHRVRTVMLGPSSVLIAAVIGSCLPLAGEHVPAEQAPDLATRAEVEDHPVQLETRVYRLAYVRPEGGPRRARTGGKSDCRQPVEIKAVPGRRSLVQLLEDVKSENGTVGAVQGTNSLVVTDTPEKLKAMEGIISRLDRPPKQVRLSVRLVVLSDKDAEKVRTYVLKDAQLANALGVDRSFKEAPGTHTLGCLDFATLTAYLDFIRMKTRGSIIQTPGVVALDHEEATINVGELIRYVASGVVHIDGAPTEDFQLKRPPFRPDIGLLVIPHVTGPDNDVALTVIPRTKSPKSAGHFEVVQGGRLGQLRLPQTIPGPARVTKVMLRDRATAIVSGLRGQWRGETVNVLVLITPTVIDFEKKVGVRDSTRRSQKE